MRIRPSRAAQSRIGATRPIEGTSRSVGRQGGAQLSARIMALAVLLILPGALTAQTTASFTVQRYTIDAELFPAANLLSATAKIGFTPASDLSSAGFQLNSALRVEKVTDAAGQALEFQQNGLSLQVNFRSPLPSDQPSNITVTYKGTLNSAVGSPFEGVKLASVSSQGSYLLYASDWFPVRPPGLDRFAATIHVTVPDNETVIASGMASTPAQQVGTKTYSFQYNRSAFPGTVLAGKYTAHPSIESNGNIVVYVMSGEKGLAKSYGDAADKILSYFSAKFGSLPDGHLDVVEIPNGTVGGYAGPGVVAIAQRGFTDPTDTRLLALEIARQWWPCLVSPATPNDAFLDDGLATYSAALYVRASEGQAAFEDLMHQTEIGALTHEEVAPIAEAGSLQDYTPEYHSVVYQKGAMVFHMLRGAIGDPAFFKTLQTMAKQDAGKTITTAGFQKLAEEVSHQPLTYFFAQWVSSTGVPQFTDSWDIYRVGNHYQAVGTIRQDLDIFRMPVEVRVYSEGRPPVDSRVDMVGTRANFAINTLTRPTRIAIDPGSKILKLDNHLKLQVEIARGDQLMQEQAYLEAIKQYRKVTALDKNDSLAHYRMGQIYFLLRNYNAAADELRAALDGDLKPHWIEVWAHLTLGEIFDATGQRDRAINEYQKALQTHDNSQGALNLANRYIQKPYTQPPSNG